MTTPTYPWRLAPDGYATRTQLRAMGLRPGGQEIAAQLMWRSRLARGGVRAAPSCSSAPPSQSMSATA